MLTAGSLRIVGAPTLETPRLRLREYRAEDLPTRCAIWSDPETVRHVHGRALTREESWRGMLACAGLWSLLGYGYWAIERKDTGCYIGDVGYGDFMRDIRPALSGMLECGWALDAAARGHGYMAEAVAAIEDWRRKTFPERASVCIIAPDNVASIRVAEKAGFKLWRETTYHADPTLVFAQPPMPAGAD